MTADFHAYPKPVWNAATKYGIAVGKYILRNLVFSGTLNNLDISNRFLSTALSPSKIFLHTRGITIRKDTRMGRFFDFIKNRAKIINEATGVAFIIEIIGIKNTRKGGEIYVTSANMVPANIAAANPAKTFLTVLSME